MPRRARVDRPLHRTIPRLNAARLADDTLSSRLAKRVEELRRHLVACASCTTCDATSLAHALVELFDALDDADPDTTWAAVEIRAILAEVLL